MKLDLVCTIAFISILTAAEFVLIWRVGFKNQFSWLKENSNSRGVKSVAGLLLALVILCFAVAANSDPRHIYLPYAYLEAGWTYDSGGSPQCVKGDPDREIASKIDFVFGAYTYKADRTFLNRVDVGYNLRHHASGFVCKDWLTVDAHGPFVRLYLWSGNL